MSKESATAPLWRPGRCISLQREQMRGFRLSLLEPVINEPLCTFVPFGGNWVWLVALAVPRHSWRKLHGVFSVCESRGEQPLVAFPVTQKCQCSWKWRKGSLSMSCCRHQGCAQGGWAAPAAPCPHGKHRRAPVRKSSALPGCHTAGCWAPWDLQLDLPQPKPSCWELSLRLK